MKRFDPNIVFGFLLLVGGGLALAQTMGILENASRLFWGGLFLSVGLVFLTLLFGGHWWAAIPGFTLLGLGALVLLPKSLDEIGGALFLGGIGLGFWYVFLSAREERWWAIIPACVLSALAVMIVAAQRYEELGGAIFLGGIGLAFLFVFFTERNSRWWALIPAGVLVTLATVTVAAQRFGEFQTAGIFFFGLAITFLLVAMLTGMRWAYWPALGLGVMGVLGIISLLELANYLWAVVMIAAGGFLLFRYFSNRNV
ncbi:MAG TPA: hypothetical protein PLD33_16835 [Anaerolineales bacterium]|nr:hypothetical protein [Anaerolineales bacterium]HMV98164.1 hypothetical protein [Anaerolineales bacterium]HMZ42715.1 hypothetical protein [Anaerolineales bacterium]HNA54168.1 hypothetical protein [Anaerolineales bacterium]HNB85093.1 hypothetical protein [Anaerolineales bacterium]